MIKKSCETCFDNTRGCSFMLSTKCVENNYFDWEPFTNADHIKSMTVDELAEWILKCKRNSGGIHGLLCNDWGIGCWYKCKNSHICEDTNGSITKEVIVKWLNSQVRGTE